jgi:hypothetical protein
MYGHTSALGTRLHELHVDTFTFIFNLFTASTTTTSTAAVSTEEMSQIAVSSSATPPTSVAPTNTTPTSNLPAGPPDPRFSYMDISVAGIGSLAPHVTVNGQVSLCCLL